MLQYQNDLLAISLTSNLLYSVRAHRLGFRVQSKPDTSCFGHLLLLLPSCSQASLSFQQ